MKKSWQAGNVFAQENYLSMKTLTTLGDIKYQLLELLVSIGFVPVDLVSQKRSSQDRILEITGPKVIPKKAVYFFFVIIYFFIVKCQWRKFFDFISNPLCRFVPKCL